MQLINTISENSYCPTISFYENGHIGVTGESRMENPRKFYSTLLTTFQDHINAQNLSELNLTIELSYVSSSSTMALFNFLQLLDSTDSVRSSIEWRYDALDDDIKELGIILKDGHIPQLSLSEIS